MSAQRKKTKVYFFVRSYNDLDCRAPLMLSFSKDKYEVIIVGTPLDIGYNHPEKHELSDYFRKKKIKFTSIFEFENIPLRVKWMYLIHRRINHILKNNSGEKIVFQYAGIINRLINLPLAFFLQYDNKWIEKAVKKIRDSILIFDELVLEHNRSKVVKEIVKGKKENNNSLYAFQTGQNLYTNLWLDADVVLPRSEESRIVKKYIVPGPNDKEIMNKYFPHEDIVVGGNTRFDSDWIKQVSDRKKNLFGYSNINRCKGKHRIVFMLSKIEYGVNLKQIIDTINVCCSIENAKVIIKPHTRGMTLNKFRKQLDKSAIDGTSFSSSELINWSKTVLFTGSSIVFQAVALGKRVIHLSHCLKYDTIFDDSGAVFIAASADEVREIILSVNGRNKCDQKIVKDFLKKHIYGGIDSGLVCDSLKNQIKKWEN